MPHQNRSHTFKQLTRLLGFAFGTLVTAHAQTEVPHAVATLREVVVSGSRSDQLDDDLPLSLDVINAREIEEGQIGDIRGAAKNLPNVSVKRAPARFSVTGRGNPVGADSNAGFNIRGQGGNRVVMLVDGVRLPRSYINGSNAFGRDSVSISLLKRIEILRGPSSVLYGSDGLAGLVNFITLEPADFLNLPNGERKALGGRAWVSYSGDDSGKTVGGTVAGAASDTAEWLLTGTRNRAGAMSNMGTNNAANVDRTTPNPQTSWGDSLLGKLVLRPTADQRHVVTLEHVTKDGDFNLLSNRAKPPYVAASVVDETSSKTMDRNRLTWVGRYQLKASLADELQTVLSRQIGAAQDNGQTVRFDGGVRVRKTSYNERAWQANVQASKVTTLTSRWSQKVTYGVDHVSTGLSSFADGSDPAPLTPFLPKKYFPDTRDTSNAIYVQSELISDDWSITPGARMDWFSLAVLSQDGYYPSPSTIPGTSLSGSAFSPKLGVMYRATPQWSVYGNYASGFRAPEAQQVNNVFEGFNAKLLPNPNLKPEKSQNVEIGLRTRLDQLSLDVAAFTGRYTNLIQEKKDLGTANGLVASPANPTLFQTVNIDKATISGFEIKGNMAWGRFAGGMLSSPFSYGQTRGTNDTNGLPLTYIEPARLSVGLKYETSAWDWRLDLTHHATKKASELESRYIPKSTSQLQFLVPAANTLDLSGQWRIRKDVRLNFAITNLTNQKYWNWSDVQGLASNAVPVVVDAYTQPGRQLNLLLMVDF